MKNTLQGINSGADEAKNQIRIVKDKEAENTQQRKASITTKKKHLKNENNVRSLWDNFRCTNIHIMGCQKDKRESKKLKTCLKK